MAVLGFGCLGAVWMCAVLLRLQDPAALRGSYPPELAACNVIYPLAAAAVTLYSGHRAEAAAGTAGTGRLPGPAAIRIWIYPPMGILAVMHLMVLWAVRTGIRFE